MTEFSIICVYNNKDKLSKFLEVGLNRQKNSDFEKILVDNTDDKYDSAAGALNNGAKNANGEYYVFIHQDVRLPKNYLSTAKQYLDGIDDLGVAGAVGRREQNGCSGETVTNIRHGEPPYEAGDTKISEPTKVNELDELILIIPEKIFNKNKFSEKLCSGWHLYGVEYSIRMQTEQMNVVVLPITLWHQSDGGWRDWRHDVTLLKIINYYPELNCIYTVSTPAKYRHAIFRLSCNFAPIGLSVQFYNSIIENGLRYTLKKTKNYLFKI